MTTTVYAVQSVLGTTDCQFVSDDSRRMRWLPDDASRSFWQRLSAVAGGIEIDWATGSERCAAPPLDLGSITLRRLSPANAAVRRFALLDGYRRVTSVVVLLAVLGKEAEARGDLLGAKRIRGKYLINNYARHPGDRWRLVPAEVDSEGWDELMTGRGTPERLAAAAEFVEHWYSIAPEGEVSRATYRLERAIAGWTSVEERTADAG